MARLVSPHIQHEVPQPHADLRQQRVQALLETFFRHTRKLLQDGSNRNRVRKAARSCLEDRGIPLDELKRLPIGLLIDREEMAQTLAEAGYRPEEIEASKLIADDRLAGRLIGPIHDSHGQILSFWARHPEDQPPKYLYKGRWQEAAGAFGLDVALPALKQRGGALVLVGDVLDAVLLVHQGVAAVAAIGGSAREMTSVRWQRLAEEGIREVTLALCGERRSSDEILAALEAAFSAGSSPRVFVAISDHLQHVGSVSHWHRAHGADAFRELLEYRVHAYHYKALALLDEHRPDGPWTGAARFAALDAAHAFYDSQARAERINDLDRFFVPPILKELGLDWNAAPPAEEPDWQDMPEDEQDDTEERAETFSPALPVEELPDEEILQENESLEDLPLDVQEECDETVDCRLLAEHLSDHSDYLGRFREPFLGLSQQTLPALDKLTCGLRGLVQLAGPAGAAKTALALQFGADVVRNDSRTCFLLVSANLSRQEAISRLKCRLARLSAKQLLRACSSGKRRLSKAQRESLESAEQELADWSRRVMILDPVEAAGRSLARIRQWWDHLKAETGCRRGVVVIENPENRTEHVQPRRAALLDAFRDVLAEDAVIDVSHTEPAPFSAVAMLPCDRFPNWRLSRLSEPAEAVLLLRRWTAAELSGLAIGDDLPEFVPHAEEQRWRAKLAEHGWIFHKLEIHDLRRPGLAAELDLTFLYRIWGFRQGLPKCRSLLWPRPVCSRFHENQNQPDPAEASVEKKQATAAAHEIRQEPNETEPVLPKRLGQPVPGECTFHCCGPLDCFCFD
ncbi:MAG: hypothetical protein HUU20_03355 [Pirellulales bacterium]|nr:hypothetical protein [Pirellulales bacterium]